MTSIKQTEDKERLEVARDLLAEGIYNSTRRQQEIVYPFPELSWVEKKDYLEKADALLSSRDELMKKRGAVEKMKELKMWGGDAEQLWWFHIYLDIEIAKFEREIKEMMG